MTDRDEIQDEISVDVEVEKSEMEEKKESTNCRVPIVEVSKESASDTWSALNEAINAATYIALDLELSGLGNRSGLSSRLADDRYHFLCEIANSYSILSFGLCCCTLSEQTDSMELSCVTFNILLHCQKPYMIEPQAVQFLLSHGFDFNKQYSRGLPYWPGNDIPKRKVVKFHQECPYNVASLLELLITSSKPIVLHNGLVDLVFMYQAFHTDLPASLAYFTADLSEMFPAGLYDTKTIAVFEEHEHATYLEYIFRKSQRENDACHSRKDGFVDVQFSVPSNCEEWVELISFEERRRNYTSSLNLCPYYARLGFCGMRDKCEHVHDVDIVLDKMEQSVMKKRKRNHRNRKRKSMMSNFTDTKTTSEPSPKKHHSEVVLTELFSEEIGTAKQRLSNEVQHLPAEENHFDQSSSDPTSEKRFSGHRAGFDAFMTAYSFAMYLSKKKASNKQPNGKACTETEAESAMKTDFAELESVKNKIVMGGRPLPLLIAKSHFTKTSSNHQLRMAELLKKSSSVT